MSQAYYRVWRPAVWDEVVGQDHIVQTLRNAIITDRVAHAYLFAGPKGTGKTTSARLLAKAVNCLDENKENKPCNKCENCLSVNEGRFLDLIEIDAASNTSVDDVRELRDKINFAPSQGKFKIYIIDEVHMLSTSAFNALLKTLEEPPPHTLFLLLAHDVKQLLPTIVSRCQRVNLPTPATHDAVDYLTNHCGANPNWAHYLIQENGAVQRVAELYDTAYFKLQDAFVHELAHGKHMDALKLAEQFDKHIKDADKARLAGEPHIISMSTVITWLQRWLHDALLVAQHVAEPRYYTAHASALNKLTSHAPETFVTRAHAWQHALSQEQRSSEHPLNNRTWLEKLLLQYTQLF